jgi:hypothetical protein
MTTQKLEVADKWDVFRMATIGDMKSNTTNSNTSGVVYTAQS